MDNNSEIHRLRGKYPDKVPIIIKKSKESTLNNVEKDKFLVPEYMTVAQFNFIIRKRLKLNQETALFVLYNGNLLPSSSVMSDIYDTYKNNDGYLYAVYTNENTFG